MTRRAGFVQIKISQSDAFETVVWLASRMPSRALLGGEGAAPALIGRVSAKAEAIAWLHRAVVRPRAQLELPRHVAEYLHGWADSAALFAPSAAALRVTAACARTLRPRGQPRRSQAYIRARLERFEVGDPAIDPRDARRLRRALRAFETHGTTLLAG